MLLDPAINLVFQHMAKEMEECKERQKQTQNELSAWKFTADSQTGKRLMAKCRMLLQENEDLGKLIASGRTAKLEGEIALEKTLVQEMKKNQADLDEFLAEIDEDVEGMQSMMYLLQQQLKESKEQIAQLKEENKQLKVSVSKLSPPEAAATNYQPKLFRQIFSYSLSLSLSLTFRPKRGPGVHMDRQCVMRQEIRAEDRYLHVGHGECPSEITSHADIQSEGPFSVRVYRGTIRSS
ncbi:WTAP [Acanthosepion pharaonis]|uniref:WTAP n=1 Tax=Acanthosepion pharaonis TaxID=158019 RepID=A0A812DGU4_ACAPH|nr:WTAP [Sepia pharaonis]